MALRERLNRLAERVRGIPASAAFDERTTSVTIRTRTWAGGRKGHPGLTTDVDLTLSPRPKVREVSMREITASGGRYSAGDVRVGPITPQYAGGGYTKAQLAPTTEVSGVEVIYVLEGGVTGEFARIDLSSDRSHSYFLTLRQRR